MNKKFLLLTVILGLAVMASAQKRIKPQNTIKVNDGDSKELIIQKAANVVPTKNQLEALKNEYIAFIHFGPNTFTRKEWGDGMEDPSIFDLKELDTDQWVETMKAAGMKMVILTVKHHDGFVIWQSRYTDHGIMSTGFKDGKGDILKELSKSCEKYGMKLGVYVSPADLYQIENPEGLYGNLSEYTMRTIPREVPGRPFSNKTKFEFEVDDYNEYFLNQLFEVLTEYGEIHEVWFDGAHPKTKGGQTYNYTAWRKLIRTLAPKAVIFGREDVRWCGNESGATRDTEWNIIPYLENPGLMNNFHDITGEDLGSREKLYDAKYLHYQQAETNTSIREGWFYRDDTHQKVRSADDVFDIYERSVGGNSTFLLNIPPNRDGRFSQQDVESLLEAGKRIEETYGTDLLKGATGPKNILDPNPNKFQLLKKNNRSIEFTLPRAAKINRVMIQEAIATHSERVEKHAVDAWINNQWQEIATGTNIGYKRILRFPEVTTNKIRIRVLEARLDPAISHVSAHYYQSRPPQLTINRNLEGVVSIEPKQSEFNWNPHGEDVIGNLNAGIEIHYTTDGSEPTENSAKYEAPFFVESKEIKTAAFHNNMKGPTESLQIGFAKKDWQLLDASSEKQSSKAVDAFDANPKTFWQTFLSNGEHHIAIDLGKEQSISGWIYTPQTKNSEGMIAKGEIEISKDGVNWEKVDTFEFGNLINDPSPRTHRLSKKINTRYIKIKATEISANDKSASIAEIDFL